MHWYVWRKTTTGFDRAARRGSTAFPQLVETDDAGTAEDAAKKAIGAKSDNSQEWYAVQASYVHVVAISSRRVYDTEVRGWHPWDEVELDDEDEEEVT